MKGKILECIEKNRIIVALRKVPTEKVEKTVEALFCGGIRMIEVTFDQSDKAGTDKTYESIRKIHKCYGESVLTGAGTVMTIEQLNAAAEAGATYILAPNLNMELVSKSVGMEIPCIPGAFTPSEISAAWEAGAELVKVFPAGNLGPSYLKALSGPMGHIPLLAMGGINKDNLKQYLPLSNLAGVGIGSDIARRDLILKDDFDGLYQLAKAYTSLLEKNEE